jgi:hypothetical protein
VGGAWTDAPKGSLVIAPGGTAHDFDRPHVAAKHAETLNACGEESAGARPVWTVRETTVCEAGRASAFRPRRAALAETVNTL